MAMSTVSGDNLETMPTFIAESTSSGAAPAPTTETNPVITPAETSVAQSSAASSPIGSQSVVTTVTTAPSNSEAVSDIVSAIRLSLMD